MAELEDHALTTALIVHVRQTSIGKTEGNSVGVYLPETEALPSWQQFPPLSGCTPGPAALQDNAGADLLG